jgi:DNA-binding transcriptional ArsR family regulator
MADTNIFHSGVPEGNEDGPDCRQLEVLSALSQEENATYSFQGLRRKLGLHQEMLSRTLDRLEEQDLVERMDDGYRINSKESLGFDYSIETAPAETKVVTACLPSSVNVSFVLSALKGRWFHEFRWLGYSQTSSGLTLSWITDDGRIELRAKISEKILTISALYRVETDQERATTSALELFDLVGRATKQNSISREHGDLN